MGFGYGLASDVGGHQLQPVPHHAGRVLRGAEGQTKQGLSLSPQQLWWQHTAGAAKALGLAGVVGNLQPGCEADFVVLNPEATPLLSAQDAPGAQPG